MEDGEDITGDIIFRFGAEVMAIVEVMAMEEVLAIMEVTAMEEVLAMVMSGVLRAIMEITITQTMFML